MKKSLIALAVMAAAGAASAQSSVTLFGIADVALQWGRGGGAGSTDRFSVITNGYNSSRLGFRGTEDLGGGMSASFWLEAGINADDGGVNSPTNSNNQTLTAGASNGAQSGFMFGRRSTVSLAGNWGELRLGRDYTPQFWNYTVFDPFGTLGSGASQANAGVSVPTALLGLPAGTPGVTGPTQGLLSLVNPVAVRASNSIGYFAPRNLGGFYGQFQYYTGESVDPGPSDGDGMGLRVGFASGPFNVAVALSNTEYETQGFDVRAWNIGGEWNFGFARLMGMYGQNRVRGGGILGGTDQDGFVIGGLVPVGAGEIRLAYSQSEVDGGGGLEPRSRKVALGYVHNLSKRTALYTTIAHVRNNDFASTSLGGTTSVPDAGGRSRSTGFDLGIRHSF